MFLFWQCLYGFTRVHSCVYLVRTLAQCRGVVSVPLKAFKRNPLAPHVAAKFAPSWRRNELKQQIRGSTPSELSGLRWRVPAAGAPAARRRRAASGGLACDGTRPASVEDEVEGVTLGRLVL